MKKFGLTNNQLKLLAMITMTIDHVGMIFFPGDMLWRLIGRLAFPVYAFMIAEGCRHTRSMGRYLLTLGGLAAASQLVSGVVIRSLYMNVLVTFSFSVILILLLKNAREKKTVLSWLTFGAAVIGAYAVGELLSRVLKGFAVDYGFLGMVLPVLVYAMPDLPRQLIAAGGCLALLSLDSWQGQWFSLLALPLLALYNGQRGTWKLKWVFYFYYPVHLGLLWLLKMIVF